MLWCMLSLLVELYTRYTPWIKDLLQAPIMIECLREISLPLEVGRHTGQNSVGTYVSVPLKVHKEVGFVCSDWPTE